MSSPVMEVGESFSKQSICRAFERTLLFLRDHVEIGPALKEYLSNDQQLQLYGLYKQSTTENPGQIDTASSWWNARRRAMRFAVHSLQHLTQLEAKQSYLKLLLQYTAGSRDVSSPDEQRNELECVQHVRILHKFVSDVLKEDRVQDVVALVDDGETTNASRSMSKHVAAVNPVPMSRSLNRHHTLLAGAIYQLQSLLMDILGFVPLQSRGQLDISYPDLRFALFQCLFLLWSPFAHARLYRQYESDIQNQWLQALQRSTNEKNVETQTVTNESEGFVIKPNVIVGLSVRTLLDLYLRVQQFPEGSEVIVSPPINVPGMMHVFHHHGLKLVGVDLLPANKDGQYEISINVDGIENAVNSCTVAILVVHVFGMIVATDEDMKSLRSLVKRKTHQSIAILEDCAECFTGLDGSSGGYLGSPYADISFFSFGLIKTMTALNGGIAVVLDHSTDERGEAELFDSMIRLHNSRCYESRISHLEYFQRVCKALILRFIADSPFLYGFLYALVSTLRFDFDSLVTCLLRGFHNGADRRRNEWLNSSTSPRGISQMIYQIRRKPSVAMLALLRRRFLHVTSTSVVRRLEFCERLSDFLQNESTNRPGDIAVLKSRACCKNYFWLFPVCVNDPETLSIYLRRCGFDATSGTSQLRCVSEGTCPVAQKLMHEVLYLPVDFCNDMASRGSHSLTELTRAINMILSDQKRSKLPPIKARPRFNIVLSFFLVLFAMSSITFFVVQLLSGVLILFVLVILLLRSAMGKFYLNSSKGFALHNSLLHDSICEGRQSKDVAADSPTPFISTGVVSCMEELKVPSVYIGNVQRSVFLTGATGFVGSMLLRDLLFFRKQLGIGRIVLLCRSKYGKSAVCRITSVLDDAMYSFLSNEEKKSLVEVVDGSITSPRAGLSDTVIDQLASSLKFTHVFHCAASVSFTQSLPEAATTNIQSALNVQNLSSLLSKEAVQFVYISTAFVHGGRCGDQEEPLSQGLCDLGHFDPFEIYRSMMGTQYYASMAMHELSFPNTYTFSKCISEHLLIFNDPNTLIIRPSIVGPGVEFPHEGWAGRTPSTLVAAACLYLSFQWNLWSFGPHRVPCIPVDVVSRFIIVKAFVASMNESAEACSLEETSSDESYEKVSRCSLESSSLSSDSDAMRNVRIYNATWDAQSSKTTSFTWFEYAGAVTQVGSVLGYFNRSTAYLGLLVATRIMPNAALSTQNFEIAHKWCVKNPFEWTARFCLWLGYSMKRLDSLYTFIDLPLLFYPFMNNSHYFHSELIAPSQLDGQRYLLNCVAAAHNFMRKSGRRSNHPDQSDHSFAEVFFPICGTKHIGGVQLLFWAFSQPQGNIAVRFAGWLLALVLQKCFSDVTVDLKSFSAMQRVRSVSRSQTVILVPTHRSIFDFLLLSFVCFALPELQVQLPSIAAADVFKRLPLVGWLLPFLGAFFVRRGRSTLDPGLADTISALRETSPPDGSVVEVFIEGTRSRDRRFVPPKTGVLRCLFDPAKKQIIVPITISYERIPEQESFVNESSGGQPSGLKIAAMFSWFKSALFGQVQLGRVHIVACEPLPIESNVEVNVLVNEVQKRQAKAIFVSEYHVSASSAFLRLESVTVRHAFQALGIQFLEHHPHSLETMDSSTNLSLLLQVSPFLAPLFTSTLPQWSKWLCSFSLELNTEELFKNTDVAALTEALRVHFHSADRCVDEAIHQLQQNGFMQPQRHHILQTAQLLNRDVPRLLLRAALDIRLDQQRGPEMVSRNQRISSPARVRVGSEEALGYWGYQDSQFVLHVDTNGRTFVRFEERNRGASRRKNEMCSGLLPFIAQEMGIPVNPLQVAFSDAYHSHSAQPRVPPCRIQGADFEVLQEAIPNISVSDADRVRHGTGHSQDDVFRIRSAETLGRVPDVVVWPTSEEDVETVIRLAQVHHWCIIPYGGGTNVSHALQCPSLEIEPRPILSLDLRRMCHILWIDENNSVAHIQAGITGRQLETQLAHRGYTLGHAPDSLEFSTLGGWIATKASGMKRNKYGNVEDIVRAVRVVGPHGVMHHGGDRHVWGRESTGSLELKNLVLGSEGGLGVITSATVRLWPLPKAKDYDGILLSDFEEGLRFVREVSQLPVSDIPVSVRLVDNDHFRLGVALRPDADSFFSGVSQWCSKEILKWIQRFDELSMVCVTLVYEGTVEEVQRQQRAIHRLRRRFGGVSLGSARGKASYELTFRIAYLRDFALSYYFLSDSFETFVPWSQIGVLVSRTKAVVRAAHAARNLPGQPFIGCRVTQLYHEGACVYFYFCMSFSGVDKANEVFTAIEHAARQEILSLGGSLSHHHGVGKLRAPFLKEIDSIPFQKTLQQIKQSMDPDNIFGARNGALAVELELEEGTAAEEVDGSPLLHLSR